jgi:hypothetical protein
LKNGKNNPTDEIVALALLASEELWIERQPRGSESSASVLIPVSGITAADVLGVYVFAKRADGTKVGASTFVPVTA